MGQPNFSHPYQSQKLNLFSNFTVFIFLLFSQIIFSIETPLKWTEADPHLPRLEYSKFSLPHAKVGQDFWWQNFWLAGMVDLQNEPDFNQGFFPNHNWKGYASTGYLYSMESPIQWGFGLEHQSAHATMGIVKEKEKLIDYLYDNSYRKYEFNTLSIDLLWSVPGYKGIWKGTHRILYHVIGKNTPELSGLKTTQGWGFDSGIQGEIPLYPQIKLSLAGYYQGIFEGKEKTTTSIIIQKNSQFYDSLVTRPILAKTSTLVFATSAIYSLERLKIGIFARFLRGYPLMYWDSRIKAKKQDFGVFVDF